MDATEKIFNTSKTVYCDFFSNRPYLPTLPSHNILNNEYLPPHQPPTMQAVTRCGDNVIADIDNATGTVVRTYVTPMLDQNVSMTVHDGQTDTTFYYNADERQSVMNLTDSTGAVAASYGYTAYGDKVDALTSGKVEQRYTYTGRELSTVSEDYNFRYRWYGAGVGGFYGRDPLGYVDGQSTYVGWFAMRYAIDPWGLKFGPWMWDPRLYDDGGFFPPRDVPMNAWLKWMKELKGWGKAKEHLWDNDPECDGELMDLGRALRVEHTKYKELSLPKEGGGIKEIEYLGELKNDELPVEDLTDLWNQDQKGWYRIRYLMNVTVVHVVNIEATFPVQWKKNCDKCSARYGDYFTFKHTFSHRESLGLRPGNAFMRGPAGMKRQDILAILLKSILGAW